MAEQLTRRDLLKAGAAAGAAVALGGCATTKPHEKKDAANDEADVVLTHGRIATQDHRRPTASALAIKGGRFVVVGDDPAVMALRGPKTLVIDANGRTVIPGLNDSHTHLIRGGLSYNQKC